MVNYETKVNSSLGESLDKNSKKHLGIRYEGNQSVSKPGENYPVEKDLIKELNVLYLDDDKDLLDSYESIHRFDFNIFATNSAAEATEIIKTNTIHIIIAYQQMPDITGLDFFSSIIEKHPNPIRILLTGYSDVSSMIRAIDSNIIYRHMSKPFTPEEMKLMIKNAAEVYFLRKEKRKPLDDIPLTD